MSLASDLMAQIFSQNNEPQPNDQPHWEPNPFVVGHVPVNF